MDTKIGFTVKGLGFPVGRIHKMYVWFEGQYPNPAKYIDDNVDKIKKELRDICHIHSIEYTHTTYSNTRTELEEYGSIILESVSDVSTTDKKKNKKKKTVKLVTDIRKLDLPNIPREDLSTLKDKVEIEFFKRDNELSDDVYDFFVANEDLVTIDEVKKIAESGSINDKFLLRKKEIRKQVELKILNT